MPNILVVDDDNQICLALAAAMKSMGHVVDCVCSLDEGLAKAHSYPYDVVFLDGNLSDGNGLNAISEIRSAPSMPEVIIIIGQGDPDGAEMAITCGAWDYIEKPLEVGSVFLPLKGVIQYRNEKNRQWPQSPLKRDNIIGESQGTRECLQLVAQSAESDINVLIYGETGTGKEQFAKAIHENSPRNKKNFVIVDCAALPETLIESVLFGHVKGAFTSADASQDGLIKQADSGTLFLDEIGELPLGVQKTFLRVLQEHCFRPVGSKTEVNSDFRLISATNRDLDQMAHTGSFREDLLFRIRSTVIFIPPLRERKQDIRDLILFYVNKICKTQRIDRKGLSPEFIDILMEYDWPGNVRELINTLEGAISIAGRDPTLFPKHLPTHIRINITRLSLRNDEPKKERQGAKNKVITKELPTLKEYRDEIISKEEKKYLEKLMILTKGNIEEACRISALSRSRLYSLIKNHRISKDTGS